MTVASNTSLTPMGPLPSRKDTASFTDRTETLFSIQLPRLVDEFNAALIFNNLQAQLVLDQTIKVKDAVAQAWAASMAPAETLPAISQSFHFGPIVKTFLYDTSKDTDGGAWRKRCQQTSWYNEPVCPGIWRKQLVNLAAAWAVTGAAVGDYYQNTTDSKFYMIGGTIGAQTQVEVMRGNGREFPEQVSILSVQLPDATYRVVIYDMTQPSCPMWMVFTAGALGVTQQFLPYAATVVTGSQGALLISVASAGNARSGLRIINYISDTCIVNGKSAQEPYIGKHNATISQRNALTTLSGTTAYITNEVVNDVTATVLDGAPIDPATGLPIPTIVVGTNGGVSVIKSDGTVVNWLTNAGVIASTSIGPAGQLFAVGGIGVLFACYYKAVIPTATPDNTYTYVFNAGSIPARLGNDNNTGFINKHSLLMSGVKAVASDQQPLLYLIKDNPANPIKGMVANITNAFNTGWLVGDNRGCWLADTVAETVTSSGELIINGTFNTDASSWVSNTSTLSVVANRLRVTNTGSNGRAKQAISTLVGRTYQFSCDISAGTDGAGLAVTAGDTISINAFLTTLPTGQSGTLRINFVATATTTSIIVANIGGTVSAYADYDNISVKLVDPDRSVKNTGLVINGSLTKSAVGSGAQLVSYSGFSASNYLEQPYNASLDFGTGDFHYMQWVTLPTAGGAAGMLTSRGDGTALGNLVLQVESDNKISLYMHNGTADALIAQAPAQVANTPLFICVFRSATTAYIYINGVLAASGALSITVTNTTGVLRIGLFRTGAVPHRGSIALLRAGATAPSPDQILDIYNTELPLFQANAKCVLPGAASTVSALASDDITGLLHVGQADYRSSWAGLLRVDTEASTVGTITSVSANQGAIITGGSTSGRYYQPAMLLRDELRRRDEARKALGKVPVFFDFDTVTGQIAIIVPKGYTVKAVYLVGVLKRLGATKDYLISFDGYQEIITFGAAPGNAVWGSIMCVRSN